MRPAATRVLLSAIVIIAFAAGVFFSSGIFFMVAVGAAVLLATSLMTGRRPLTRALQQLQGHGVDVRLWGAPPAGSASTLTITAVNALGAGIHVFFAADDGTAMHLKIAQPKEPQIESGAIVVRTARYVQWNGHRVPPVAGEPAVSIALTKL